MKATLKVMIVRHDLRGNNIGTILLKRTEQFVAELGYTELFVSQVSNPTFFRKNNYTLVGDEWKKAISITTDDLVFSGMKEKTWVVEDVFIRDSKWRIIKWYSEIDGSAVCYIKLDLK